MILINEQHAHLVINALSSELSRANERLVDLIEKKSSLEEALSYMDMERKELTEDVNELKSQLSVSDARLVEIQNLAAEFSTQALNNKVASEMLDGLLSILCGDKQ